MWTLIRGFATRHASGLLLAGKIIGLAVVLGSITLYVHGAEKAKARNGTLEEKLSGAEVNLKRLQAAFESCAEANRANALRAAQQKERALLAELRLAEMAVTADRDVEDIEREELELRSENLGCPAITPAFRSVFGDS